MGQVVALNPPVEKLVLEIRAHVHDAGRAESTCAKHQLQAGLRLIELRATVEREGGDWWALYEEKFTGYIKSRKYAEKLMKWARSDDPDAAMDAENEAARERMTRVRSERSLRERDLVGNALHIVAKMSADERENFFNQCRSLYEI